MSLPRECRSQVASMHSFHHIILSRYKQSSKGSLPLEHLDCNHPTLTTAHPPVTAAHIPGDTSQLHTHTSPTWYMGCCAVPLKWRFPAPQRVERQSSTAHCARGPYLRHVSQYPLSLPRCVPTLSLLSLPDLTRVQLDRVPGVYLTCMLVQIIGERQPVGGRG